MTMKEKVNRYKELEKQLDEYAKRPVADKVKPRGNLEKAILKKMTRGKEIIANRSSDFTPELWNNWDQLRTEDAKLCDELEEAGIITYNNETGEEIIHEV